MATIKRSAISKSKKTSLKRGATEKSLKSFAADKDISKHNVIVISSRNKDQRGRVIEIKPGTAIKVSGLAPVKLKGAVGKGSKKKASTPRGSSSTAPVVYKTLRERVAAVEKNMGKTQTLREFLDSVGWK